MYLRFQWCVPWRLLQTKSKNHTKSRWHLSNSQVFGLSPKYIHLIDGINNTVYDVVTAKDQRRWSSKFYDAALHHRNFVEIRKLLGGINALPVSISFLRRHQRNLLNRYFSLFQLLFFPPPIFFLHPPSSRIRRLHGFLIHCVMSHDNESLAVGRATCSRCDVGTLLAEKFQYPQNILTPNQIERKKKKMKIIRRQSLPTFFYGAKVNTTGQTRREMRREKKERKSFSLRLSDCSICGVSGVDCEASEIRIWYTCAQGTCNSRWAFAFLGGRTYLISNIRSPDSHSMAIHSPHAWIYFYSSARGRYSLSFCAREMRAISPAKTKNWKVVSPTNGEIHGFCSSFLFSFAVSLSKFFPSFGGPFFPGLVLNLWD